MSCSILIALITIHVYKWKYRPMRLVDTTETTHVRRCQDRRVRHAREVTGRDPGARMMTTCDMMDNIST